MVHIRYEVWTRPESALFELKFPLRGPMSASFTLDMFGQGSLEIPLSHNRLDDILSIDKSDRTNDEASVIRAFIGEVSLFDFYVSKLELNFTDTGARSATATGDARGTALNRARVRQYDYPALPSIQPDHSWGLDSIVSPNAGMEESPNSLQNPGAEDGNTEGWIGGIPGGAYPDTFEPDTFTAVENTGLSDTGDWHFEVTADYLSGVFQTIPVVGGEIVDGGPDIVGKTYTVTARIKAPASDVVDMVVTNAKAVSTGTYYNGTGFAQITGNGAYQTATVIYEAESSGESEIRFISADTGGSPITFQFDTVTAEGFGIGVDDWNPQGDVTVFQASAILARTGSFSLAFFPNSGVAGNEKANLPISTTPGQEISASVWVYHTEGSNKLMSLYLTVPGLDPAISAVCTHQVSVPTVTWTKLECSGTAQSSITDLEVRWDETGVPASNLHIDDAEVTIGKPAALLGVILDAMFDDAGTDHSGVGRTALAWLTRTWTASLDSAGNAWDEVVNITIRRGITYREMIEQMEKLGYQFSIDVNPADSSDWRLNAYNPGGMGTDHSLADGPAILSRPGVLSAGPFARREPIATYEMYEGEDLEWAEYRDADLETAWGEIEHYTANEDFPSASLLKAATEVVDSDASESIIVSFAGHPVVPGIDYFESDSIRLTLGNTYLPSDVFKIAGISVRDNEVEPQFQVEFQPV